MHGTDGTTRQDQDSKTRRIAASVAHELRQFLVMFVYLWVLLLMFKLNQLLILEKEGMSLALHGLTIVNALMLAKVMVLYEHFDVSHFLRDRPLIYPVLFESLLLTVLFIVFHIAEHVVIGMIGGETLRQSIPIIGKGGIAALLCVACILFFSLMPFFAFKHLTRVLGAQNVKALFFGERAPRTSKAHG